MDCSSTFWIPPPRLISMTGIWRRQATDIVVIVHFSPFLSFSFPLCHPPPLACLHPHPHSCPHTPDHSPSEARSCCPTDSCPCSRPTLSLLLSMHLHQQEPELTIPWHQECIAHDPQLIEVTLPVCAEHHESPPQSPVRHRQKHGLQVEVEMIWQLEMKRQLRMKRQLPRRHCHPPWNQCEIL